MLSIFKNGKSLKSSLKLTWISVCLSTALIACNNGVSTTGTAISTLASMHQGNKNQPTIKTWEADRQHLQVTRTNIASVNRAGF